MTPLKTYTLKEVPEFKAWQWKGPEDNRGVVEYTYDPVDELLHAFDIQESLKRVFYIPGAGRVTLGDWIIDNEHDTCEHVDIEAREITVVSRYEVMPEAEFKAKCKEVE